MSRKWWLIALVLCLILATITPLASSSPDGLEKVAEEKGFIDATEKAPFEFIADYIFPGIENKALATILAAWLGVLILFAMAYGLVRFIKLKNKGMTTNE
ncbi:MAG: PDGLE domain-containing protein [Dehalococcoidia bacterium]|nr:MAG: PDGLE domain-containing protein [Dehalococcoidia bacterium]